MTLSLEAAAWIRRFHPAPSATARLVCFPHAGGSASYFHPVSAALSPAVEVLAVQYPGRQDRHTEPLVDDLFVLADGLAEVLAAETAGPVAFFGHSMGASLAFEVARRLEPRGTRLLGLFVSGRRAPTAARDERTHEKDDEGLLAEVKRLSGTDAQVLENDELVRMVLPALRSDYKAAELYHYRPGADVSCPVVALIGDHDPKVTEAEARQWAAHTSGGFELKTYPGGHFYLNEHAAAVTRLIGERLAG
ncbi:alpha/beta fold hydrolase [Amycolatopsis sp. OK19-0408]|uniref:Alpha/beta fold hydrolase n=1 Tax=Amycolatopsis iheyensis TaxID=2945988 RepID=A0A9X2SLX9_9PSEU|nr:alpha/beta fold hydrolase [Amycolatopsis iheyensis]MCR6487192.1 alpha/beta fold hydrolase [Amycolatopsis iheyensis]